MSAPDRSRHAIHCAVCPRPTTHGKPWCAEHVTTQSPYALQVAALLADFETERARVEAGGEPDPGHAFAKDVVGRQRSCERQLSPPAVVEWVLAAAGESEAGGLKTRSELGLKPYAVNKLRERHGLKPAGRRGEVALLYDPLEVERAQVRQRAWRQAKAEERARERSRSRQAKRELARKTEARARIAQAEQVAARRGALAIELRDPKARAIAEGAA